MFTTSANGEQELPEQSSGGGTIGGVPVRYFALTFPKRYFAASGLRDAVRQLLRKVDLVHLHGLWNIPVWTAAVECMKYGVPFVVSPRGMLDHGSLAHHRWRKEFCYRLWERRYLCRATFLHATSDNEEASLGGRALGPEIACIPNGLWLPDAPPPSLVMEKLGVDGDRPIVLYLGRLHPSKRLDLLVAATAIARQQDPRIQLVIAGAEDGIHRAPLLGGAPEWCRWVGEVDDANRWAVLSEASVLVMCSDSESFGMSVLESLAAKTPVVVTRTCPWGVVERERCGFWVEQRAEDIASAILKIVRDPAGARAMGERGRKLVEERFFWGAIGRQMARRYERALMSST